MTRQLHTNYTDCGVAIVTTGDGSVGITKTDSHRRDLEQLFLILECGLEQRTPNGGMQENFLFSK